MSNRINDRFPYLIWWGRADRDYSRNRMILGLLRDLGWRIGFFHPASSHTGWLEAFFHRLEKPDIIWVPCFRHTDIASASFWSRRWHVPLVVDPLISAYEKEVFEKLKWDADSKSAEKHRRWESDLFAKADTVIADTPVHGDFFCKELSVNPEKLSVLYVGAESVLFGGNWPAPLPKPPYEVLFYGSYLELQGVDIIVKAAGLVDDDQIRWVLVGNGNLRKDVEKAANGKRNISFEPWIDYQELPKRIARAHIVLGVFGTTLKANMVIPNKVFQSMAMGKPLITRRAAAYPHEMVVSEAIGWVEPGDPKGLAEVVKQWLTRPESLIYKGIMAREFFERFFSETILRDRLEAVLAKTLADYGKRNSYKEPAEITREGHG